MWRLLPLPLLSVLFLSCLPFANGQPAQGYTWGQPPLRLCISSAIPPESSDDGLPGVDEAAQEFDAVPGIDLDCVEPHVRITFYLTSDMLSPEIQEWHRQLPPLGIFDVNGKGCPGLWATAGMGPLYGITPEVSPECNGTIANSVIYFPSMGIPDSEGFAACAIWRSLGVLSPCSESFESVVRWLQARYGLPAGP